MTKHHKTYEKEKKKTYKDVYAVKMNVKKMFYSNFWRK